MSRLERPGLGGGSGLCSSNRWVCAVVNRTVPNLESAGFAHLPVKTSAATTAPNPAAERQAADPFRAAAQPVMPSGESKPPIGTSAYIAVPAPVGLTISNRPPSASMRSFSPIRPDPRS
jgi:hypothetical protein